MAEYRSLKKIHKPKLKKMKTKIILLALLLFVIGEKTNAQVFFNGGYDPYEKAEVQQKQDKNLYLKLISGKIDIQLSACPGGQGTSLVHSKILVPMKPSVEGESLGSYLQNMDIDYPQLPTPTDTLQVYEVTKEGTLNQIIGSLNFSLEKLTLTQEQINKFCIEQRGWLSEEGFGTFFLFCEKINSEPEFYVACIYLDKFSLDGEEEKLLLNIVKYPYELNDTVANGRFVFPKSK